MFAASAVSISTKPIFRRQTLPAEDAEAHRGEALSGLAQNQNIPHVYPTRTQRRGSRSSRGARRRNECSPIGMGEHNGADFAPTLVEEGGFEPPKSLTTDLQSAPFGHSGTPPYC